MGSVYESTLVCWQPGQGAVPTSHPAGGWYQQGDPCRPTHYVDQRSWKVISWDAARRTRHTWAVPPAPTTHQLASQLWRRKEGVAYPEVSGIP